MHASIIFEPKKYLLHPNPATMQSRIEKCFFALIRMKKKINPWENPQVYPSGVVSRLMISCIKNNS